MTKKAWLVFVTLLSGLVLTPPLAAANFLFSWKASTDPSVTAYGIYERQRDSDYVKIDEVKIEDLDNPNNPNYLFTDLADGSTYWFAVSFIYASGDESDLHSQTCIKVNGDIEDCDDDDKDGTSVYLSCFILTAGEMFFHKKPD